MWFWNLAACHSALCLMWPKLTTYIMYSICRGGMASSRELPVVTVPCVSGVHSTWYQEHREFSHQPWWHGETADSRTKLSNSQLFKPLIAELISNYLQHIILVALHIITPMHRCEVHACKAHNYLWGMHVRPHFMQVRMHFHKVCMRIYIYILAAWQFLKDFLS